MVLHRIGVLNESLWRYTSEASVGPEDIIVGPLGEVDHGHETSSNLIIPA